MEKLEQLFKSLQEFQEKLEKKEPHYHIHINNQRITDEPVSHSSIVNKYGSIQDLEAKGFRLIPHEQPLKKDDLDEKIHAKIKAAMTARNFSEADATKHVIDRDRGDKIAETPKPPKQELLQSERLAYSNNGQWSLNKDNSVKPFGENIYNSTANMNRKATRTTEERPDSGKNIAVRRYTTTGSAVQAAHEKRERAEQYKKNLKTLKTLKDISPEKVKEIQDKLTKK